MSFTENKKREREARDTLLSFTRTINRANMAHPL